MVPGLEHARDILFGMRFGLDLYANVRPIKALDDRLVPLKGRTAKDVGADLAMSPGAVRVAKSRVLRRLRQELGDLIE